jgi:hypothetical protein
MNAQLKQQIDEKLEHLSETHIAEVLDFVQFFENKERQHRRGFGAVAADRENTGEGSARLPLSRYHGLQV